uniref:Uncharacterized protein n=1 Tax=Anguilla anguilla TaxID=7936 RepID=A0A0E9QDG8_ANGAN
MCLFLLVRKKSRL